jgi:hypothetical protein
MISVITNTLNSSSRNPRVTKATNRNQRSRW